jgi:molybdopterin/thiamine biosynthesis adenylyltransferase
MSKAEVAAAFVEKRVKGVSITPHNCKIQDKDESFYKQFNMVICGLDSIEARRWINSTLVDMVNMEDPDSLKPLIDGGTEGKMLLARSLNSKLIKIRIQGPGPSYIPNNDILHRMSVRYARSKGGRSSLYSGDHSSTT